QASPPETFSLALDVDPFPLDAASRFLVVLTSRNDKSFGVLRIVSPCITLASHALHLRHQCRYRGAQGSRPRFRVGRRSQGPPRSALAARRRSRAPRSRRDRNSCESLRRSKRASANRKSHEHSPNIGGFKNQKSVDCWAR